MEIQLEQLPHQEEAIQKIIAEIEEQENNNRKPNENPLVKIPQYIDIKMETGTGKTYVYTRAMYEFYKEFQVQKFIIVVPSLAIKEGTKNFISADYVQKHFREFYHENYRISLCVINSQDFKSKGNKRREIIPSHLMSFFEGNAFERNTIHCLLINEAMLRSIKTKEFDQTLQGGYSNIFQGLKSLKPIIIIDEPHKFKDDNKAMQDIMELNPQCILRFGATFPQIKIGKGETKTDYKNLVYDLNAVKAFNQGLVKGVNIQYPNLGDEKSKKYKVISATDKKLELECDKVKYTIEQGCQLPSDFGSYLTYEGGKNKILSNELSLGVGTTLLPEVFHDSYQALLIEQALKTHFDKEEENWLNEIKTLSLFFIDSIKSYRSNNEDGWLKLKFEELLRKELQERIKKHKNNENYKAFLEASLIDIEQTHAGYFAEDTNKKEEEIQKQIDDILKNKTTMLSFKDKNGNWVVRRFFFSKWTLREGWDNPNIFVITKLRKSGSETSKIQEVGRGLRLPVNAYGKRMSEQNNDYHLDLILDWSEKGFADSLVNEINENVKKKIKVLDDKTLENILKNLGQECTNENMDNLFEKLWKENIIDRKANVLDYERLQPYLPDNGSRLKEGKITENGRKSNKIQLKKENWKKIQELWEKVTKRYRIKFENVSEMDLKAILKNSVENSFQTNQGEIITQKLNFENEQIIIQEEKKPQNYSIEFSNYGTFLKKLSQRINVPVSIIHEVLCEQYPRGIEKERFNETSIQNICNKFEKEFIQYFSTRYNYSALDFIADTKLFKRNTKEFVDEIEQNYVGLNTDKSFYIEENYLYNKKVFDSEIEQEILKMSPEDEVIVFGKLPRESIKVPLYTGGTSSPDFVYAIKQNNNTKLGLFIESKPKDIRLSEERTLKCHKKYFDMLDDNIKWNKVTSAKELSSIFKDLIKE